MEAVDEEVYEVVVTAAVDEALDIAWVQGEMVVEEEGVSLVVVLVVRMMTQVGGVVGVGLVVEEEV